MIDISDILRDYAAVIFCEYGDISGEEIVDSLNDIADFIEKGITELNESDAVRLRNYIGICRAGGRHLLKDCNENCFSEVSKALEGESE